MYWSGNAGHSVRIIDFFMQGLSLLVMKVFSKTDFRIELPLTRKLLFDVKCDDNGLVIQWKSPGKYICQNQLSTVKFILM